MSRTTAPLGSLIGAAHQAVRRDAVLATVFATFAVIPTVLVIAWLLSLTTNITRRVPLTLDAIAIAIAIAIGVVAVRSWISRITNRRVAAAAEVQLGFSEGELQGVLELDGASPAGTSSALLHRAEHNLAERLSGLDPREVGGQLALDTRRRRMHTIAAAGSLSALVVILAFASPERSRASWSPLLRPVAALAESALPPLEVLPGDVNVPRGGDVAVRIRAAQREAVTLYWRARGDVLHEVPLPVLAAEASADINAIDAPVRYWVRTPDRAVSDTFTITPIDPLLVSALTIEVVYPAYLQRAPELFDKDIPPLELPQGAQLRVRGRSTQPLSAISLQYEAEVFSLAVADNSFAGTWSPRMSGTYEWLLVGTSQTAAAAAPAPIEIKVTADAPPEIEITYPGVDTLLPADMKQLLVADARDDHEITNAAVVSWRTSAIGQRDAPIEQAVSLEGEADRKLIRGLLDATSRGLLPGDTLSYFVRVVDNSPARQMAVSRTFTLRVPGMDELRGRAQEQAEDLVKDAAALSRAMQQLENRTRELQRKSVSGGARAGERGRGGSTGSDQKQLSSEQAEQARQVLDNQQAITSELEKLRDRIESLERAAENAGLRDPETQKRLEELKQLYDQLMSPELKKQLQQLQSALDKLDPEEVQKALEELAKQQAELRAKLDQSLELARRAAAEQEMTKLSQEAKELATQQEALAEKAKSGEADPRETADQQKEIEKKTNNLGSGMQKLKTKLSDQGETDAASKTAAAQKKAEQAEESMSQAGKQAAQKQTEKAGESGQQAADKLAEAANMLDAARKEMTASWKKETQETVDNATQDAINLAQKQQELLERMKASAQAGNSQQQPQPGAQKSPGQQGQQGDQKGTQSRDNGKQQGGEAGEKGQGQKAGSQGKTGSSSGQPGGGEQGEMQQLRSEQAAVKQGLEQLGKNLSEAGQRSAMVNRDVGAALARANLTMEQMLKALEQATPENMPGQQGEETLDALNRLALELLKNSQQIEQSETGTGLQEALKQLAELAKQQGNLNGRSNTLLPLNLGPKVMSQQLGAMAREQRDIAQKLGGMNKGGARDDLLGKLDELVKEADAVARDLEGGRLTPQTQQRQAELFHKLLDAGRTMERDEVSDERKADAAMPLPPSVIRALKPGLFDDADKFAAPTADQLRDLPPAYRRLILEYFQKLNSVEKRDN